MHRRDPHLVDVVEAGETVSDPLRLLTTEVGETGVVEGHSTLGPVGLTVSDEEEVHITITIRCPYTCPAQYDGRVTRDALVRHLVANALRTDGPFTLRSGAVSSWYLDARQTTFDGRGARLVGEAVLSVLDRRAVAVGGMTMGADPIAVACAIVAADQERELKAFSVRKEEKGHGVGGRLVGPVESTMPVALLEDTTTTGSAAVEAAQYLLDEGFEIVQAIALVDRSGGKARAAFAELGIEHVAIVTPPDLGVSE
jgi:orotate phosphoribosyltransferase